MSPAIAALAMTWLAAVPPSVVPQGPTFWVLPGAESGGAHQAGVMVALIGHERQRALEHHDRPSVGGISGTSAGSLNAVMAALQLCADPESAFEPENNLLWETWRDLSWDALFPGDRDCRQYARDNQHTTVECSSHDPDAYSFRDGLWTTNAFAGVRRVLTRMAADSSRLTSAEQWTRECRVQLAITLGAERPDDLFLGTGDREDRQARLATSRRFTTVSLRFSDADADGTRHRAFRVCDAPLAPRDQSVAPPATRLQLPFVEAAAQSLEWDSIMSSVKAESRPPPDAVELGLARGEDACHRISLDAFLDLLTASMAVPLAFAPQPVAYCGTGCERIDRPGLYCPKGTTLCGGRFLDGSRFDGQPLSAAVAMSRAPNQMWSNEYVVAGGSTVPATPTVKVPPSARGSAYYLGYVGGFVETASQYEQLMLKRYEVLSDQSDLISEVPNNHPLVADLPIFDRTESILGATFPGFTAFLHPNFRLFDYYLGIADGMDWLARRDCSGSDDFARCVHDRRRALRADVNADVSPGLSTVLNLMFPEPGAPGVAPPPAAAPTPNSTPEELARAEELERIWRALDFRQPDADSETVIDDPFRIFINGLKKGRSGVDPYLGLGFADDMDYWRYDQLRQLFHRLVALESEDGSQGTAALAAVARFVAAMKATEYRSGFSLGQGSVPRNAGPLGAAVQLVLPYRLQGDVRSGDLDLGWTPVTLSLFGSQLHGSLGLTGHWFNFLPAGPKWSWGPTAELWFTGHNKGRLLRAVPPLVNLVPDVGVRATWFLGPYREGAMGAQVSVGGFLRLLGHLELEIGGGPPRGIFVKLGVTDVNGLLYWGFLGARASDSKYAGVVDASQRRQ